MIDKFAWASSKMLLLKVSDTCGACDDEAEPLPAFGWASLTVGRFFFALPTNGAMM